MSNILEIKWTQRAHGYDVDDVQEVKDSAFYRALAAQGRVVILAETEVELKVTEIEPEVIGDLPDVTLPEVEQDEPVEDAYATPDGKPKPSGRVRS